MLKGWNRKVRITRAISRAWMTTRTVSPKPLSDFVPDVTLMAFPIPPHANAARWQSIFLTRIVRRFASRKCLDSDAASEFRRKPEFTLVSLRRFRRLFAAVQSTAASKLANPLTSQRFLVLRRTGIPAPVAPQGLPGWTAEIMTKA